jgi:hypothetical protein
MTLVSLSMHVHLCSLRGRLLADEDYDNREQPTAAKQQGNVVAAPDAGRYLGVKGAHRGSEASLAVAAWPLSVSD